MTPHMADDEVLRVFRRDAELAASARAKESTDYSRNRAHESESAIAAVAALQAERDALRNERDYYQRESERRREDYAATSAVFVANEAKCTERAERAESALEALRGEVAGLVKKWRLEIEEYDTQNVGSSDPEDWMSGHRECLGELLAMKNSGEF